MITVGNHQNRKNILLIVLAIEVLFVIALFTFIPASTIAEFFQPNYDRGEVQGVQAPTEEKASVFEENLQPIYEPPVRLYFDTVDIDIPIIEVGVESDGKLQNPQSFSEGGWYFKSAHPGENGNVIINAHYDDFSGNPAAFWQLKNVLLNDRVFLVDALGKVYTYEVIDSFYVDINDPDRLSIFSEDKRKSELTLITCGGVWDYTAGTYNKRLVVKAELIED